MRSLAELAEALHATELSGAALHAWVDWALNDDVGREPLLLATSLHQPAASKLLCLAADEPVWERLELVLRSLDAGASPDRPSVAALADTLIAQVAEGDETAAWAAAVTLTELPLDDDARLRVLAAVEALPAEQRTVVRALSVVGWDRTDADSSRHLEAMLEAPPTKLPRLGPEPQLAWLNLGPDRFYSRAYEAAVRRLLRPGDEALASRIIEMMSRRATAGATWRLRDVLVERGFDAQLEAHDREQVPDAPPPGSTLKQFDDLLALHAEVHARLEESVLDLAEPADLAWHQRRRLGELADLLETVKLGEERPGSVLRGIHEFPDAFSDTVKILLMLVGADPAVLGGEILELRDIVEQGGESLRFAAVDGGSAYQEVDWRRCADANATVVRLVEIAALKLAWASEFAAMLVETAPERAAPAGVAATRTAMARVNGRHLERLAEILLTLDRRVDVRVELAADPRPGARRALVHRLAHEDDEAVLLPALIVDGDEGVRQAAIRVVARRGQLEQLSARLADAPSAEGWQCRWCLNDNERGRRACAKCQASGPDPLREARRRGS